MDEQAEVIGALRQAGVLVAIRWAYESAVRRALETYSPQDGHDTPWLGNTRYVLFRDRLDRVFRCDRYAVSVSDAEVDPDQLFAELSEQDVATFPRVEPGTVVRHDLHGSPGWTCQAGRFLIASGDFGFVRTLPWAYKSRTKRIVAMQRPPVTDFEDVLFGLDDLLGPGLGVGLASGQPRHRPVDPRHIPDLPTFVVAHSLEPWSAETELIFGRPRMNAAGGSAWYWLEDLGAPR
ncbi:MAG TPA: hypothetical protein VMU95_32600 [Trebonia sp.]|nr:hypothetical protein [Trebonia sp.]